MTLWRDAPYCPGCGRDFREDRIIYLDGFRFDPRGTTHHRGRLVTGLSPTQQSLLFSIAKAAPRLATMDALIMRSGSEGGVKGVQTQLSRARTTLEYHGAPILFVSVPSHGYIWVGDVAPSPLD